MSAISRQRVRMGRNLGQATKEKAMIEVLPDMPQGVTGIRVSGRLRGEDLREFKPAMEDLLKTGEIRIVEVVAPDYEGFGPGGLIEDLKLGLGALIQHHSAFKRIAVVSDKDCVAPALMIRRTLCQLRAYTRPVTLRRLPAKEVCDEILATTSPRD